VEKYTMQLVCFCSALSLSLFSLSLLPSSIPLYSLMLRVKIHVTLAHQSNSCWLVLSKFTLQHQTISKTKKRSILSLRRYNWSNNPLYINPNCSKHKTQNPNFQTFFIFSQQTQKEPTTQQQKHWIKQTLMTIVESIAFQ
jgi:hypothetical protein